MNDMQETIQQLESAVDVSSTRLLGADPNHFVWRMTNGRYVHPECREAYQKKLEAKHCRPSIDAAVSQGYAMSRFTLCEHCQAPIWDAPNAGTQRPGSPDGPIATETRKPGSLK